jgi:hypothetical protein
LKKAKRVAGRVKEVPLPAQPRDGKLRQGDLAAEAKDLLRDGVEVRNLDRADERVGAASQRGAGTGRWSIPPRIPGVSIRQ